LNDPPVVTAELHVILHGNSQLLGVSDIGEPIIPEVLDVLFEFVVLATLQSALHLRLAARADERLRSDGNHSIESVVVQKKQ
jgi:hypothetical protein